MSKSKLDKISRLSLSNILETSKSFEEVYIKIGYKQFEQSLKSRLQEKCKEYGLDCSFLEDGVIMHKNRKCIICGEIKPINDFYSTRNACKDCVRREEREKYTKKMNDFIAYKKTLCCQKCGESRHYLLDFHHKDPLQKDYTISDNTHAKLETIMKEIQKCIPLCSNCHREFHYLQRAQSVNLEQYLNDYLN